MNFFFFDVVVVCLFVCLRACSLEQRAFLIHETNTTIKRNRMCTTLWSKDISFSLFLFFRCCSLPLLSSVLAFVSRPLWHWKNRNYSKAHYPPFLVTVTFICSKKEKKHASERDPGPSLFFVRIEENSTTSSSRLYKRLCKCIAKPVLSAPKPGYSSIGAKNFTTHDPSRQKRNNNNNEWIEAHHNKALHSSGRFMWTKCNWSPP